jgi:outer membrane lipopolysaccharide assembly protein LptE/RlpB
MNAVMRKILVLTALCFLLADCGYHLRGTGSNLPPSIKRVDIPMFKNMTTRFELDVKLTQSVIEELVTRGRFAITGDSGKADAVLLGEIVTFNVNPIAFSNQSTADRYNITIVAKIVLRDLTNQKVIFSNPNFVYTEQYEVPAGTSYETWETQAISTVAEKFARSLVTTLLEGF